MTQRTTRLAMTLALAVTAAGSLLLAAPARQHAYLVTVIAEDGKPVIGLTADDFVVREGSTPLKVIAAEHSSFPLVVSLVVDTTKPDVIASPARELREALAAFVDRVRAPGGASRVALMEVSAGTTMTASHDAPAAELDAAIARIFPAHPSDAEILEAIGEAARGLTDVQSPRRAIVIVDFNSGEAAAQDSVKRVFGDLARSGATVWAVSLRLPRANTSRREGPMNEMTRQTGGLRLVASAPGGLDALLARVADSLVSQYIVTFERNGDGQPDSITMETTQGLKVHVSPMRR